MRKCCVILFTVFILGITISVAASQDSDGDVCPNPWQQSHTPAVSTTSVQSPSGETATTDIEQKITTDTEQKITTGIVATDKMTSGTDSDITTTSTPLQTTKGVKVGKTRVKKAVRKKGSAKISLKLKRIKGAKKYQVQVAKNKKFKKILIRRTVRKINTKISDKKIKNRKKLYVRARAVRMVKGTKYYGRWSGVKRIKIKK